MIGGDVFDAGAAGGEIGAPRGRARAGVDDVDLFVADHDRRARRVAPDRERVLGVEGAGDDLRAGLFRFGREAPACGRDPGLAAGRHDRARDVDRRALRAAGIERGDDLQDGERRS